MWVGLEQRSHPFLGRDRGEIRPGGEVYPSDPCAASRPTPVPAPCHTSSAHRSVGDISSSQRWSRKSGSKGSSTIRAPLEVLEFSMDRAL